MYRKNMATDYVAEITGRLTCSDDTCHDYVEDLLVDMVIAMEDRGYSEASFGAEFGNNRFTGTFIVTAENEAEGRKVAKYLLDQICDECRGEYEDDNGPVLVDEEFKAEHMIVWNNVDLQPA